MRDWTDDASCKGLDTELFYVEPGQGTTSEIATIIKMCNTCAVKLDCLNEALKIEACGPRSGIWGGATPRERNLIARERLMDETGLCPKNLHVMETGNTGWLRGRLGREWRFCLACRDSKRLRYAPAS